MTMSSLLPDKEPLRAMNPTWPDEPPEIQYLTEMTKEDMQYTRTPSADRSYSYKERFDIDNYEIKKQVYGELSFQLNDERFDSSHHKEMEVHVAALKSHRKWGGVDARQIPETVTQIKDRSAFNKNNTRHPVYAATPTNESEFPFDARDVTQFVSECERRLNHEGCKTVKVHGTTCPVIALYGMPCSPFQNVYDTNNEYEHKKKCVGFGNVECSENLVTSMQQEGTQNTINESHGMLNGPPEYTKDWRMKVHEKILIGTENAELNLQEGSYNIVRAYTDTSTINKMFPTSGFWSDPLTYECMEILDSRTKTPIQNDGQRDLFEQMASSNGVVLRGNKPQLNEFGTAWSNEDRTQLEKEYKKYPELYSVLSEAYTTLIAAACGLHPPVFALLIAKYGNDQAIMLSLTELGTSIFPTSSSHAAKRSPFKMKLSDSPQFKQHATRIKIAQHISKRLSDLIFKSSDLGLMTLDIKNQNLVAMYPYKIPDYNLAEYSKTNRHHYEFIDTSWIAMDVMHIDCSPMYTCFIPRTVRHNTTDTGLVVGFLLNRTSGYVYTTTTATQENYYMVQSACLRLITLFMTVLHTLCNTFRASDKKDVKKKKDVKLYNELIYLSYQQLFVDIKQILRNRKSNSFGPICNGLFTQSDWDAVLEIKENNEKDRSLTIQHELQKGWETVANLNNNENATQTWNSIANLIKFQMKHYSLIAASNPKDDKYCTSALYKQLNSSIHPNPADESQSEKKRFRMTIENFIGNDENVQLQTIRNKITDFNKNVNVNNNKKVEIQKTYKRKETMYVEYTRENDNNKPQTDLKRFLAPWCGKEVEDIIIEEETSFQRKLRTSAFNYKEDLKEYERDTEKYHSDMFMMLTGFLGHGLTQLAKQISLDDSNLKPDPK